MMIMGDCPATLLDNPESHPASKASVPAPYEASMGRACEARLFRI
jgi:hypothetical protein